ncbi:uncharacterized protein LOC116344374 [Contarinia nasturtii]|uniref:uncharacterized protein LOC116344374 n=1 Tax=Contarinia nasturtii TaxID=265458 RepID=UPI0012D49618|nr:uncharacterized protein LOC116344374 [Contarinia nasturtii]
MAAVKYVSHFFSKNVILILLFIGVVTSAVVNNYVNALTEPCYGAGNGRVRALTIDSLLDDCNKYVQCLSDQTEEVLTCPFDKPYFNAEDQECSHRSDVCFRCPNTKFELISVPHICRQYILCFNNKPLALACPEPLVFDGSPGIHQCNYEPGPSECFREDKDDYESKICPPIGKEPKFEAADNSGIYYVCHGSPKPLRLVCQGNLIFNKDKGVCEKA